MLEEAIRPCPTREREEARATVGGKLIPYEAPLIIRIVPKFILCVKTQVLISVK